jgi:hypothetical protein
VGQGRHRGQALLREPGGEHDEVGRVGPFGVLGAGGACVRGSGVVELEGLGRGPGEGACGVAGLGLAGERSRGLLLRHGQVARRITYR